MIKAFIAALALSTLSIPQVNAATPIFSEVDLLKSYEALGGRVYVDSDRCAEGFYGMTNGKALHICTEIHAGDVEEMRDTVRHEVWHVVQMCHGGAISSSPAEAISIAYSKGWTTRGYEPDVWHEEAEAYHIAATRTAEEINNALLKTCQ